MVDSFACGFVDFGWWICKVLTMGLCYVIYVVLADDLVCWFEAFDYCVGLGVYLLYAVKLVCLCGSGRGFCVWCFRLALGLMRWMQLLFLGKLL